MGELASLCFLPSLFSPSTQTLSRCWTHLINPEWRTLCLHKGGGGSNKYRHIQRECTITVRSLRPLGPEIERARQRWEIYGARSLHLPPGWEHGATPRRRARRWDDARSASTGIPDGSGSSGCRQQLPCVYRVYGNPCWIRLQGGICTLVPTAAFIPNRECATLLPF